MKILNNKMMNDYEYKKIATGGNDGCGTWSVRTESNSYMDDLYWGDYEETKTYAERLIANGEEGKVSIALITLDEEGCSCYDNEVEEINYNLKFHELLKKYRMIKKLTQKEMAEKLEIDYQAYQRWEYGKVIPSAKYMFDIKKILEIPEDEIVESLE